VNKSNRESVLANQNHFGKPPKSEAAVRQLLKDIHMMNDPSPVGPHRLGLPKTEDSFVRNEARRHQLKEKPKSFASFPDTTFSSGKRKPAKRKPAAFARRTPRSLMGHVLLASGLAGLLIGFNVGIGLVALMGQVFHLASTALVFATIGCAVGIKTTRFEDEIGDLEITSGAKQD
jgi:hypothetical protein